MYAYPGEERSCPALRPAGLCTSSQHSQLLYWLRREPDSSAANARLNHELLYSKQFCCLISPQIGHSAENKLKIRHILISNSFLILQRKSLPFYILRNKLNTCWQAQTKLEFSCEEGGRVDFRSSCHTSSVWCKSWSYMSRIHYHFLCDLFKHALMLSDNIMLELSSGLSRFAQQLMNHWQ